MAKAFLVRWGTQNDFDSIKLQIREIGFTIDNEKMYIGGNDANIHIPNESFIGTMISEAVPKYKPMVGTGLELVTTHLPGAIAFNSETSILIYKTAGGSSISLARSIDLPAKTVYSVKVAAENIDAGDNNSVLLTNYERPIELIFLNGVLCTPEDYDAHKYTVNIELKTLKINGCVADDTISYF